MDWPICLCATYVPVVNGHSLQVLVIHDVFICTFQVLLGSKGRLVKQLYKWLEPILIIVSMEVQLRV